MTDASEGPEMGGDKWHAGNKPQKRDYEVGYGKPPKSGQFKPGRSGNVSGQKRKREAVLDIDDILDKPVEVSAGGKLKPMEPRKIALLAQIKKARNGNLQALAHVTDKLARYGLLGTRKDTQGGGAVHLPNTMPFAMAMIIARHFGPPPWLSRGAMEPLSPGGWLEATKRRPRELDGPEGAQSTP